MTAPDREQPGPFAVGGTRSERRFDIECVKAIDRRPRSGWAASMANTWHDRTASVDIRSRLATAVSMTGSVRAAP